MMTTYKAERVFMNTKVSITANSNLGTVNTNLAIEDAFLEFDNVMKKYTRFEKSSELAKLNNSFGKSTKISKELFYLIEKLIDAYHITKGRFDPTIIDLLEAWGYKKNSDYSQLDDPELLKKIQTTLKSRASAEEIVLNKKKLEIKLVKNQKIDLGSIGKGYAIDLASNHLKGFFGYSINAGGDIKSGGFNESGKRWNVGLTEFSLPNKKQTPARVFGSILLKNMALASSGGWVRRVKSFHHLLSTTNGLPENKVSQAFVTHKLATIADLWATILFLCGKEGIELVNEQKGLEGMIIDSKGNKFLSKNFKYKKIEE